MNGIRLFCIPYAGGSSISYSRWKPYIHSSIELIPIELSGRGRRFVDPFYPSIEDAVEDVYRNIIPHIDGNPYAIWGHSMGALITYELTHLIQAREQMLPIHLFCSGTSAPDRRQREKCIHNLPDNEFLAEIQQLEGTPTEFFDNQDLVDLYIPVLRNDFKIVEQYSFQEKRQLIQTNLSVLYGNEESYKDQVHEWNRHTNLPCNFYKFNGKHFFIFDHIKGIADIINKTLMENQSNFAASQGGSLYDYSKL